MGEQNLSGAVFVTSHHGLGCQRGSSLLVLTSATGQRSRPAGVSAAPPPPPPALASAEGHGPQVGAATPTPLPAQTAFQGGFLSRRRVPCRCPRGGGACGARVRWGEGPGSAGAALGSPRLGVARPRQSPRGPRHRVALSILHVRCPAPRGLPPWKCPPRAGTRLAPLRSPQWQGARHRGEELTSPRHGPGADPEHSHQPAGHSEDRVLRRLGRGLRCRLNPLFTWCGCHCPPRA